MDTVLVLLAIGLLGTFHFMSVITLKNRLESVEKGLGKQKDYWKSVESSIEIQSNQISKEIHGYSKLQEKDMLEFKRRRVMKESDILIAVKENNEILNKTNEKIDEHYNKLCEQIEGHDEDVAEDNEMLKVAIGDMHRKLSNKINSSIEDINKATAQQVARLIYIAPMIKFMNGEEVQWTKANLRNGKR